MPKVHLIDNQPLYIDKIEKLVTEDYVLDLSENAKRKILKSRSYLDQKQVESNLPMYGINTGFGSLCNVKISNENLAQLQENLVLSHACGTGDLVEDTIVRLMLLFKIQSLSQGYSGVSLALVERLILFFNQRITPLVYQQGSLGASGDLAPLSHMSLPILGKGQVYYKGQVRESLSVLNELGVLPLQLKSKEGLALLNGTQFMSAHGVWALIRAKYISGFADFIGAISTDAFDCNASPFDELVHQVQHHFFNFILAITAVFTITHFQIRRSSKMKKANRLAQQKTRRITHQVRFFLLITVYGRVDKIFTVYLQSL